MDRVAAPVLTGLVTVVLAGDAHAQGVLSITVNATINASASLTSSPIDFGTLIAGRTTLITAGASSASGVAGQVLVEMNGAEITVVLPREMVLSGGSSRMTARLECAHAESAEGVATAFDCGGGQTFRPGSGVQTHRVIFVGGSIDAAQSSDKPAGAYVGTVVVTATYSTS